MKLAISNIAWSEEHDAYMLDIMKKYGFTGLEIAPTRIFKENPYDALAEKQEWEERLWKNNRICVPSMQSIWYGRQERLFGTEEERESLLQYTKKAIDFAASIKCKNLVFGCPKNRNVPDGAQVDCAIPFFYALGEYAVKMGTVIGMEANPAIYNTNYINDTLSALDLIQQVKSNGFKLNLDVGTMIQNQEEVSELENRVQFINHVHISEPGLKRIEKRHMHEELAELLKKEEYEGYVSIEMGKQEDLAIIEDTMEYVKEIFE